MSNRFNLIDEPWIPVANEGLVSLKQIFSNKKYRALGGNPVHKIALMKLLQSIGQAAATPADDKAWSAMGIDGLSERCLDYLEQWHDRFYLYGDVPFLQMPAIHKADIKSYGAVLTEVATGNTTLLTDIQVEKKLTDAERALLIVEMMNFALGGKKADNSIVLTPGYTQKMNAKGRPSSSKPGPSVAHMGLLHTFLVGENILETTWLNLLTAKYVDEIRVYPSGVGTPPWEQMPEGENCPVAQLLKQTLQGRLVSLSRFCLLTEEGVHFSEGILHPSYKEGVYDPTITVNRAAKDFKALWVDAGKRPWRNLTSLLGFLGSNSDFQNITLQAGVARARPVTEVIGIWAGGLRVSSNAGEQYTSGSDDYVDSLIMLRSDDLGSAWYDRLKEEMSELEQLSKTLFGRVAGFFKSLNMDGGKKAGESCQVFWQLCERDFQTLVYACDSDEEAEKKRHNLRNKFAHYVWESYDMACSKGSARQLDAWAGNRPNLGKYLKKESK